jgi:cell division protein ZapA
MAQVALDINGRRYEMACDDGEEPRLRRVGHFVDQRARALARQVGPVGENRLLLMAALMIADEYLEVTEDGGDARTNGHAAAASGTSAEDEQAAEVLEGVAERLERIAARLESS